MPLFGPPNIDKLVAAKNVNGLLGALRHREPSVRTRAALALGDAARGAGPRGEQPAFTVPASAIGPLATALKQERDPGARKAIAAALGTLGHRWTGRDNLDFPYVRLAIDALEAADDVVAVEPLLRIAYPPGGPSDREQRKIFLARQGVGRLIGRLGQDGARVLVALLREPGHDHGAAAEELEHLPFERKLEALLPLVEGPDAWVDDVGHVERILDSAGDIRALIPLLALHGRQIRRWDEFWRSVPHTGVHVVPSVGKGPEKLADSHPDELLAAVHHSDRDVRLGAVDLGDSRMSSALSDVDEAVRLRLAARLILSGQAPPETKEMLPTLLRHPPESLRNEVIKALGKAGPWAVDDLAAAASGAYGAGSRHEAIAALGTVGDPRAVEPLIAMLRERDLCWSADRALWEIGDTRAVEPLLGHLEGDRAQHRHPWRLEPQDPPFMRITDPSALDLFIDALRRAVPARPEDFPAAQRSLTPREVQIALNIIQALGEFGDPRAVPAIVEWGPFTKHYEVAEWEVVEKVYAVDDVMRYRVHHDPYPLNTVWVEALKRIGGEDAASAARDHNASEAGLPARPRNS